MHDRAWPLNHWTQAHNRLAAIWIRLMTGQSERDPRGFPFHGICARKTCFWDAAAPMGKFMSARRLQGLDAGLPDVTC